MTKCKFFVCFRNKKANSLSQAFFEDKKVLFVDIGYLDEPTQIVYSNNVVNLHQKGTEKGKWYATDYATGTRIVGDFTTRKDCVMAVQEIWDTVEKMRKSSEYLQFKARIQGYINAIENSQV